jgi:hypothetical protein
VTVFGSGPLIVAASATQWGQGNIADPEPESFVMGYLFAVVATHSTTRLFMEMPLPGEASASTSFGSAQTSLTFFDPYAAAAPAPLAVSHAGAA